MKLSRTSLYAIYALCHLARRTPESRTTAEEIGEARGIPTMYLRKVLGPLVAVGIIRTRKGPGGGYSMAKLTRNVSLLQVIQAVEGTLNSEVPDISANGKPSAVTEQLAKVYDEAAKQIRKTLESISLASLVGKR